MSGPLISAENSCTSRNGGLPRGSESDARTRQPSWKYSVTLHVLTGFWLAIALAILEVAIMSLDGRVRQTTGFFDLLKVGLYLAAMYLPVCVVAASGVGFAMLALRRIIGADALPKTIAAPSRWFEHSPRAFSWGAALLAVGIALYLMLWRTGLHFFAHYHDIQLSAHANALLGVAFAGLAAGAAALAARATLPIARRMGRAASAGGVGVLVSLGLIGSGLFVFFHPPKWLQVLEPNAVLVSVFCPVFYLWLHFAVRRLADKIPDLRGRLSYSTILVYLTAVCAIVVSAFTYGNSQVVRTRLEQNSAAGLKLLRLYAVLTDRDGDGYSWAFGGGDCDDGNPDVYPGAVDLPGDGIDSNCFAGDNDPQAADLSDGDYGKPPPGLVRPNFLLIIVDALRPDHLGTFGYTRPISPNIDAFARGAIRFRNAFAQSSRSVRSIPSLFIGRYPSQIRFGSEFIWPSLAPENETVAEVLRDNGYRTAAVIGTDYFSRCGDFFQGFDYVWQANTYKPSRALPRLMAIERLKELNKDAAPWFMWVHMYGAHAPYLADRQRPFFGPSAMSAYDTEIALADREVGQLIQWIDVQGLTDRTVVIVASDHGEAFGEHGRFKHSYGLYDEELRATLLIKVPQVKARLVKETVGQLDLTPTLLNLARIPLPKPLPARSLVPLIMGERQTHRGRILISELMPDGSVPRDRKAIRRDDMKLIWGVREGSYQLYDLRRDPGELNDLADSQRDVAKELLGLLRLWVAQTNLPENQWRDVLRENRLREAPQAMSNRLDLSYGGLFTLLGFNLPKTQFKPGERIAIDFYYRVETTTRKDLFFEVTFDAPPNYRLPYKFHANHFPLNGFYRTYQWQEGEILRDPVKLMVPDQLQTPATLPMYLRVLVRNMNGLVIAPSGLSEGRLHLADLRFSAK